MPPNMDIIFEDIRGNAWGRGLRAKKALLAAVHVIKTATRAWKTAVHRAVGAAGRRCGHGNGRKGTITARRVQHVRLDAQKAASTSRGRR